MATDITKSVVGASIGVILIATLGGEALTIIAATNTTTWDTATVAVWAVLAIIVVVTFLLLILKYADIV